MGFSRNQSADRAALSPNGDVAPMDVVARGAAAGASAGAGRLGLTRVRTTRLLLSCVAVVVVVSGAFVMFASRDTGAPSVATHAASAAPAVVPPAASTAALDQLAFRIAMLERQAVAASPDRDLLGSVLALIAVQEMRRRLQAGQPFVAEISALRRVAPPLDGDALSVVERHAAQGLETAATLRRQFARMRPMLERQAATTGSATGWFGRAWHGVLVTLSIADAPVPDGVQALHRIDAALAADDLDMALAAAQRLDGEAARMLRAWLSALGARLETERALDALQMAAWQRVAGP